MRKVLLLSVAILIAPSLVLGNTIMLRDYENTRDEYRVACDRGKTQNTISTGNSYLRITIQMISGISFYVLAFDHENMTRYYFSDAGSAYANELPRTLWSQRLKEESANAFNWYNTLYNHAGYHHDCRSTKRGGR
ncbi:MAG: hypothetical protein Q7R73_01795 [bacterium]|nr:hypothetical protein [bacterium]